MGNFVLKKGENKKINSTFRVAKIAPLHPIGVVIKATSPRLLRSEELDQLSRLRRSENDQ